MTIANVNLSNTFNEFRVTTNEVITEVNKLTDGLSLSGNTGSDTISIGVDALTIGGTNGISTVASANTLVVNLDDTGVVAGTYGNESVIPIITIDAQGRISIVNTANVAGVSAFNYYSGNANFVITEPEGSSFTASIGQHLGTTANVTFNRVTVSNLPTNDSDLANKLYVDEIAQGIAAKPAVRAATTADLSATYNNGANGVGSTLTSNTNAAFPTLDGVSGWAVYDGVLVKDQNNTNENGRFFVSNTGSVTYPWILTRCGYCDEPSEVPSAYVFVQEGTLYGGTGWVALVTDHSDFDVGVDGITWTQFSGAGTYTAGDALSLNGTQFNVEVVSGGGVEISSDALQLSNTGVSAGTYGSASQVPVLVVDNKGRVTSASNVNVAGVSAFNYHSGNANFQIATADGGSFTASIGQDLGTAASVTFSSVAANGVSLSFLNASNVSTGTLNADRLATSGVSAGTYGSASQVPVLVVDNKGRVTSASNVNVAGVASYTYYSANANFVITTADGGSFTATIGQDLSNTASVDFANTTTGLLTTSNGIIESVSTITLNGGTTNVDISSAGIFDVTLSSNSTITFTNPPAAGKAKTVTLFVTNSGGGAKSLTVTNAKYTDGVAPILSSNNGAVDALSFITINGGTSYYGSFILADLQ